MTTIAIIFGLIIVIAVIYLSTFDGEYHIDRNLQMKVPAEKIYQTLIDFKTWPKWSPWLLHEPDTSLEYSENYKEAGGYYSWDGKIVGAGKLSHITLQPNSFLKQQIEFIRPFKSICKVEWVLNETPDGTEVHWIMQGKMPFLFRL